MMKGINTIAHIFGAPKLISLDPASTEVFQILRSYDYTVMMFDDDGNQIYEPDKARRFFAKPENLLVSIVEDADDSSIRLYLGKSTDISDVIGLDQTLRATATKYNLMFNLRRYDHDLKPADFSTKASVSELFRKENTMNYLLEGMYGTTRSSYLKMENARMIVRHSKKIDEMVMGSRGRHIDAIFIENAQGERFLMPTQTLAAGRAMTQHVNHGGGFADQVGAQILRMAFDYQNLGQASGYIASNSANLSESAQVVRETCRQKMREMRKCFERLSRGYVNEAARIEEQCSMLNENEENNLIDLTEMHDLLIIEGDELSENILRTVAETMKAVTVDEGRTAHVHDGGIETVSLLNHQVSKIAWDKLRNEQHPQLDIRSEPTYMSGESPRFTSKTSELAYKLGELAAVTWNDSLANFLSYVASEMDSESRDPKQKLYAKVADVAIRGANVVKADTQAPEEVEEPEDALAEQSEAVREFDEWMETFSPNSVLSETDEDDFDDDLYNIKTDVDGNPDTALDDAVAEFNPEDFLNTYGSDFNWGDDELSSEDKEYDKAYILNSLSAYLQNKVKMDYGIDDVDADLAAKDVWDKVEPFLTDAGYMLSEDDFSHKDMILPDNPKTDFKREVTKSSSTDPYSGEATAIDDGYTARLRQLSGMPH